jgi:hypothetical protein
MQIDDSNNRIPKSLKRRKRIIGFAIVYLSLWLATWIFGPNAVNEEFKQRWGSIEANSKKQIDFRTHCLFNGSKFTFLPEPVPDNQPWFCVGSSIVPAPFILNTEFAYSNSGLSAGAGRVLFLWTPWGCYSLSQSWEWIS